MQRTLFTLGAAIFLFACGGRTPTESLDPSAPEGRTADNVRSALLGTYWSDTQEGCAGTYVTWHGFLDAAELHVVQETRSWGGPDGSGFSEGPAGATWSVDSNDLRVELEWSQYERQRRTLRTPSFVSGPLAGLLFDTYRVPDGAKAWTDGIVLAEDPATFRGAWEEAITYEDGSEERWGHSVFLGFDAPLTSGEATEVTIAIGAFREKDGLFVENAKYQQTWPIRVDREALSREKTAVDTSGLASVVIGDFEGDFAQVRSAWSEHVRSTVEGPDEARLIEQAFHPQLAFDVEAPEALAIRGYRTLFMVEQAKVPGEITAMKP